MKKIWLVIAVCLLFSLMLLSCNDSGISTQEPQKTPSEAASLEESPSLQETPLETPSETASLEESPDLEEDLPGSEGLQYILSSDGKSYVLTGLGSCQLADIVIPAVHEGKPVSGIAEKAFTDSACKNIKTVTIANGLTSIGNGAFGGCTSLESIVIPDSVTKIDTYAFANCGNLKTVTLGNGLQTIGDGAFQMCGRLANLTLPDSLTEIGLNAFAYCRFESIVIPKGVMSMGRTVFAEYLEVYCEKESKPEGWDEKWKGPADVYWGGSWEYVDGVPTKK